MKLLLLMVFFIGASWGENDFGNTCYSCNQFNPQGQGFMAHPNTTMCCLYLECWKIKDITAINQMERNCPPGTWFDPEHGPNGIPCIAHKPYDHCVAECLPEHVTYEPGCHYFALTSDKNQFGPKMNGVISPLWHCVVGAVFDEGSCTCSVFHAACFCLADISLTSDTDDHSCTNGDVVSSGTPVTFTPVPPFIDSSVLPGGAAGVFSGPTGMTHLNAQVFSGIFTPCDVKCLSVGLFFNAVDTSSRQGLVSYGACDPVGASWQITIENSQVHASIGAESLSVWISANQWYYFSFVYRESTGVLKIYLMSVAEAVNCATNCICPPSSGSMILTKDCAVEPRPCGLEIGHTGTEDDDTQFFTGQMARVQVFTRCNMMACETAPCMLKGKRGRWRYPV